MHTCHVQRVPSLQPGDYTYTSRTYFAQWHLKKYATNTRFTANILFTDEASFTTEAIINAHNTHFLALKNPLATRRRAAQIRLSFNVLAGIVGNQVIGPYLLYFRLTRSKYLIFPLLVLAQLLDDERFLHRCDRQCGSNKMGPLPISAVTFVTTHK